MGTMTTYARLLATLSILAPARGREEMISPELLASCSFTFCTICTLREFISAETESLGCSNLGSRAGIDLASALASSTAREPIWVMPTKRSEEHTSELQSLRHLVCRLLLAKKKRI